MHLNDSPLFTQLASQEHVLLAGMGGGYDLYCAIPLYFALRRLGKRVTLGSLTFANTWVLRPRISQAAVKVTADSGVARSYFPERHLCAWMREQFNEEIAVVCFERDGEQHVREGYQMVVEQEEIDALVLVDGGTDSLMRGDEAGLGTPHEDILSIAAASAEEVDVPVKLMACLGFGIDAFHGVCHAHMLNNVADLLHEGGFLGTLTLLPQMPEAQRYIEAVDYANACWPSHQSIVNNSIVSALEGHYGDVHRTERTKDGTLWINPLMMIYWAFQLEPVARQVMYMDQIRGTTSFNEVIRRLESYEGLRPRRTWTDIPV